jgi:hypothetical protein
LPRCTGDHLFRGRQRQEGQAKKLIEAARHWASGPSRRSAAASEKYRQDLRDLKLSDEQIDAMLGAEDDDAGDADAFWVLPENWDSIQVFSSLNRCWRLDSFNGKYLGLDRPSIESTLRLMGIPPDRHREILEDLQIMENAALQVLNANNQ